MDFPMKNEIADIEFHYQRSDVPIVSYQSTSMYTFMIMMLVPYVIFFQEEDLFDIINRKKMWRYFTHTNKYRYVDVLQEQVSGYNESPHKSVGMAHIEVNDSNQLKIGNKYYSQGVNRKPFKFVIRDHERISREKRMYAKRYVQSCRKNISSQNRVCVELQMCTS